jgi:hypothetical protein
MYDKVAHTPNDPTASRPSSSNDRPKRVLLLCAESMRPHACCVEDALRARGWSARLEIGKRARRWVRRAPPGPPVLRILLVPEQLDSSVAAKLRAGCDPTNRGDLQIVSFETPRGVITEIERLAGYPSYVRRRPVAARRVLAHPTLCEQALHTDRQWRLGVAAAVAAFSMGWASTSVAQTVTAPTVALSAPSVTLPTMEAQAPARSALIDAPVYSAVSVSADALTIDDEAEMFMEGDDEIEIEIDYDPETSDDEILIWDDAAETHAFASPTAITGSVRIVEPVTEPVTKPMTAPTTKLTKPAVTEPVTEPVAARDIVPDEEPPAPAAIEPQRVQTIDPFAAP